MSERVTICWFRQDLRLHDNPALVAAAREGAVLPLYVLDDDTPGPWAIGGAQRWWLHRSLAALADAFRAAGLPLILRRGRAADIVPAFAREAKADAVHAGIAHEPWWRAADAAIAPALETEGRRIVLHRTATLFDLESIRTKTGGIYGVFGAFARAVEALVPDAPRGKPRLTAPATPPASDALDAWGLLPTHPDWAAEFGTIWTPGEAGGRARLAPFLRGPAAGYATGRNLPATPGTSMFSPHLHWGEVSPRAVWHALAEHGTGEGFTTFRRELVWRDFAAYLAWHRPAIADAPLRPQFADLPFRRNARERRAWQRGRTGIPIVDAGMRQLWRLGWMHNRVRMIAASFAVKHLLIDWREGERWFWDTLVDADFGSNSVNWQWVAGTGIDAQPFFRVFNPRSQGEKFDPEGAYVRRYVPEIARLPDRYLHAPWTAPAAVLAEAGVELGRTYPRPVIDLDEGRRRALETYRASAKRDAA
jgi:deoxyribodipyrimidine photo-lyase